MAKFLNSIQLATTGSVDTPESGFVTIYTKTDGNIYVKFSNGTEKKLSYYVG